MEDFFVSKRMELDQLQTYLVKEFQDLEIWRQKKDNILTLFGLEAKDPKSRYASRSSNKGYNSKNSNKSYSKSSCINYSIPDIFKDVKALLTNIVIEYKKITDTIMK